MSEPETQHENINADDLYSETSMRAGNGPIDRFVTRKLFDQKYTNVSDNEQWVFFFDDNDIELALYKLESGEHWLFIDNGQNYELVYVGTEDDEVRNELWN